jgi:predicted  nucleic acid-binding Zn-ribbon protein
MHPQLEVLLELQDLKAQKREMGDAVAESSREIEQRIFRVKPEDAIAQLETKIQEMESDLEPEIANRYRQISSRRERTVVPVLEGMCYGCFVAVPTSVARSNEAIHWCESCGSFIYFVA